MTFVILFRSHIATQQFPVKQKHNHRLKLTTHGLSLVKMKSRYGIRVIATEEAAHRDLRPGETFLKVDISKI